MQILNILSQYLQPLFFSFFTGMLFTALAVKFFPRLKLLDKPLNYGIFRKPIPYCGGLAIFLAFLIAVFIFIPLTKALIGLLIGAFIIIIIGFLDDMFRIHPFIRLFFQFVACLILVFSGIGIFSINIPFWGTLNLSGIAWNGILILSAVFTIIWVMVITNVMNFLDGVSGLTSGISFIAGLTLFILSIHPGIHADLQSQIPVATLALIIAMVSLAFFIFDFPKPKILMGDTGSTFLGFVLAVLAIFSGGKVATAFLVLGIPILDMIWVVLRRLITGQKIWKGDLKHLHHRLIDIGFSERKVVLLYLAITAVLGLIAVLLVSGQQKFFMMIALGILMMLLAGALVLIPKRK